MYGTQLGSLDHAAITQKVPGRILTNMEGRGPFIHENLAGRLQLPKILHPLKVLFPNLDVLCPLGTERVGADEPFDSALITDHPVSIRLTLIESRRRFVVFSHGREAAV